MYDAPPTEEDIYTAAFFIGYDHELSDLPYDPTADLDPVVSAGYSDGRLAAILDTLEALFALADFVELADLFESDEEEN
jgi:hypothetical protein